MAESTDFQVGQGENFKVLIRLLNRSSNNTPLDITNYTFAGQVRENYTTDEVAATFNITPVSPYTSGSLFVELAPAATLDLTQRKYVYDVNISSGSALYRRILEGSLVVRPAVTR